MATPTTQPETTTEPTETSQEPQLTEAEQKSLDTWNKTHQTETPRPEGLPEKFDSLEDFVKSYSELETKLGELSSLPKPPEGAEGIPPTTSPLSEEDIQKFTQEFTENGGLSDASFAEIEQMGVPRAIAENYVRGLEALRNQQLSAIHSIAGGAEQFDEVMEWAAENMSAGEKAAYNKVLETGDMDAIRLAFRSVHSQYREANPQPGQMLSGDGGSPSSGAFGSVQEMVQAMQDPRYKTDPAYRKQVEQRVARSNL